MSMTKTGIIGLVVLIVILIGGYSIVTQSEDGGPLGENGTTTNETENGTTTEDETNEDTDETTDEADENTDEGDNGSEQNADDSETSGNTGAGNGGTNTNAGNTTSGNAGGGTTGQTTGGGFGAGVGGSGDAGTVQMAETQSYSNSELGVSFDYPETWDVDEDDEQVVAGRDFAGGMKAEMTVTVHEDVEVTEMIDEDVDADDIVEGVKYAGDFDCKEDDLDCAGSTVIIAIDGEETEDGWEGKVVEVNFGVYEMPDYDGPNVDVSPDELLEVSGSAFSGALSSLDVSSV